MPAVGNQMAVVGNPLAAWVSPELLVTGLGSDTGCPVALDTGALWVTGWRGSATGRVLELPGYRAGLSVVVVLLIYW